MYTIHQKRMHRESMMQIPPFQIKICISWTLFFGENKRYLSPLIREDTSTQMYQEPLK